MIRPELVPSTWLMNTPPNIGGISVPNAAQSPNATAIPKESPRKRIVNPKVRPPTPHSRPKKKDQNRVLDGASERTARRSRVIRLPSNQGAMIQLKNPPTSQYVSQDH